MTNGNSEAEKGNILWIDDEIELLRPHTILLQKRGFVVDTASNGDDAVELVQNKSYDLIFLDEMMVGISGLETLTKIKELDASVPVVMVTKSEEEQLMEEAVGNKISDYLTKPVNPAQILMTVKKFLESGRIETEKFTQDYLQGFNQITQKLFQPLEWNDWVEIYNKLVQWSMELDRLGNDGLKQTLQDQWREANAEFSKFVENNYFDWVQKDFQEADPIMSPHLLDKYIHPFLKEKRKVFFFVVDCMRLDQWLVMKDLLSPYYNFYTDFYCGILPTATQFARNAIFSGLYPLDIKKHYPQYWKDDTNSEEHKLNAHESDLFEKWLERRRIELKNKPVYIKIFDTEFGNKVEKSIDKYTHNQFTSIVINAVDMIAHSRSDYAILKEIAPDESAYRSLTKSWFQHSNLFGMLKNLAEYDDIDIILTTDHGSVRCMRGVKVLGDRDTSTNLRYKFGKNVKADKRHAMQLPEPEQFRLPSHGITVNNIIAKEDYYFVYPTDYNLYLNKYKDSFQHGGISMEEMIVPFIRLERRK